MPRQSTPLVESVCQQCGEQYFLRSFRLAQGRRKYCSRACRDAARRTAVDRTCQECGAVFQHTPAGVANGRGKYCSLACRDKGYRRPIEERFWSYVDKSGGPEACWLWTGAADEHGYGRIRVDGKMDGAHRVAYAMANGPVPDGEFVCHACDNPPCVNPAHLFAGSPKDNGDDMRAKGREFRHGKGEDHVNARLTWEQVREIRSRYAIGGITTVALARCYGISDSLVRLIIHNKRWRE